MLNLYHLMVSKELHWTKPLFERSQTHPVLTIDVRNESIQKLFQDVIQYEALSHSKVHALFVLHSLDNRQ